VLISRHRIDPILFRSLGGATNLSHAGASSPREPRSGALASGTRAGNARFGELAGACAVPEPIASEFVFGGRAIAAALGLTTAATYHALKRGHVPGARHCGGRWALHLPTLRASFGKRRCPRCAPYWWPHDQFGHPQVARCCRRTDRSEKGTAQ
jgi:hypothetical protein